MIVAVAAVGKGMATEIEEALAIGTEEGIEIEERTIVETEIGRGGRTKAAVGVGAGAGAGRAMKCDVVSGVNCSGFLVLLLLYLTCCKRLQVCCSA